MSGFPSNRRSTVLALALVSGLLMAAGGGILVYYGKTYTDVKHFRVSGTSYLKEEEVLALAKLAPPFTRSDLFSARSRISEHPAVQSVSLDIEGEDLVIRVHERECMAVLSVNGSMIDVDSQARILFYEGRCAAVVLSGAFHVQGGTVHGEELKETLSALSAVRDGRPELEKRISEVVIRKGYCTVFLVHPSLQLDVPDLTAPTLERITASVAFFEKEGKTRGRIDLRGKNVLILPQT